MTEVYLYKLTSGETVIGEFRSAEVINERTNETAHMVGWPMKVHSGHYGQMDEWVPGCIEEVIPISMKNMMFIATGESIDEVLLELYHTLVYGTPEPEKEAEGPISHHQV